MSDYSNREPTAGDIKERQIQDAARGDINYRGYAGTVDADKWREEYIKKEREKKETSTLKLLSSPLLIGFNSKADVIVSTLINMLIKDRCDPFDSFCEVVSHWKGMTKEEFIKMEQEMRDKIVKETS